MNYLPFRHQSLDNLSIELVSGIVLASISGVLFTANNFVINQSGVDVGDVILVRTVIQVIIYVLILMYRGEDFLPPTRIKKIYTILQGNSVFPHIYQIHILEFRVRNRLVFRSC